MNVMENMENNFDVIVRDGKNYAPPIYDNGGSLLAWATDAG